MSTEVHAFRQDHYFQSLMWGNNLQALLGCTALQQPTHNVRHAAGMWCNGSCILTAYLALTRLAAFV
jgi:hypothetical protein